MRMVGQARLWTVAFVLAVVLGAGCTSAPRSTRCRMADVEVAVQEVAKDMAGTFLADRIAESPPIKLLVLRGENLSRDRLSAIDRWGMVSNLIFEPGMMQMI